MKLHKCVRIGAVLVLIGLLLALAAPAWAEGGLMLSLNKIVGSKLGSQCQGRFALSARATQELASVTYMIDGAPMATVDKAPFGLSFDTGQYPLGVHRLSATARTTGGATLTSDELVLEFVSASSVWRTLAPVLVVILALALLGSVGPALLGGRKKQRFEPGVRHDYGPGGGTICPRCRRPFAYNLLGASLVVGKLQRCPYCGKWAVLRRASPQALAAAEAEAAGEAKSEDTPKPLSAEEKLRRQIEDSKYQ